MARFSGRTIGLWAGGLIGLVTIAPLAVFSPIAAAFVVALGGLAGTVVAQLRVSTLTTRCEKLSQEVDVLSQRLLRAERQSPVRSGEDRQDSLKEDVHELTVEIGLLSGIVRDLSAVIRSQDSEIAALKARPVIREVAVLAPKPALPPLPPLVSVPPGDPAETDRSPADLPRPEPLGQRPPEPPPAPRFEPPPITEPARTIRPIPPRPLAPPDRLRDDAILSAFDADQLDIYLQPVVTLPQRKVIAYEALARLRVEEQTLDAHQYLPALERHGRTTELDRRMLARTGTIVGHLGRRGSDARVTYGLSPLSLFEPGFLREIGRMAGEDQALSGLDIALPQASWRGLDSGQLNLLGALQGRIGFCLDRATDLRFDAHELAAYGIGQVRVPAELLLRPAPGRAAVSDIAVEDLAPALQRARIRLVVAEVGSESDIPDLIELNVPFAQGNAFAPARPVRGEILAPLAPEPPSPPPPPPEDDPGPERRSFRSLLRRAG